jgi:hypothetical protein
LIVAGVGTGLALSTATDAALETLTDEQSGVGSALLQAMRIVAGGFGTTLLFGVIDSQYRGRLDQLNLPRPREMLNWRKPIEVFNDLLASHVSP